ncbi:MAG TPA: type II toxin-antitoxin system RelE/ParE family toxin [Ktedonobacteraceae bacterium]|nr:type II toxin-antitoxin system RelE/ParE family toxin [Ktedonobacteraceae bacterium]
MKEWQVILLPIAKKQLSAITDLRVRQNISKRIDRLRYNPDTQGKLLADDLEGYRSLRAVEQRYRIIYKIEASNVIVTVVALGIRKDGDKADVYALAKKLARLGLLDSE